MERVLISPGKYVQGAGSIRQVGTYVSKLGQKALVVADKFVLSILSDVLRDSFEGKMEALFEEFAGECSKSEIERLKSTGQSQGIDVVVGVGGGKTLDTAKAVAYYLHSPVAVVPTIAATDAPCSALSVIYTPRGEFEEYLVLPKNPDLVLVDTQVVANAPVRFLVSGMGDALATWFEADACSRTLAKNLPGGSPTITALSLARLCYDTLLDYGVPAKLAVEKHAVTPAVERIVEANTLLSGLGFESGGLAAAHAIHNGLTVLEETHKAYHGEKVAFSTIVQLVLEDRPTEEIYEVVEFCSQVGLPLTLSDLGAGNVDSSALMQVSRAACKEGETIHNMPFEVTPEMVYNAILGANAIGEEFSR